MQVVERPVIGLCGDTRGWASLGRTLLAYKSALAERYTVVQLNSVDDIAAANVATIVNFSGSVGWLARARLAMPIIVCLHGGGTVNYPELPALLSLLGPDDTVIGNCVGDMKLLRHLVGDAAPRFEQLTLPVSDEFQRQSPQSLLASLKIPTGAAIVGFVARATPKKGLHHFIRTVHWLLQRSQRQLYGIVVGDFSEDSFLDYRGQTYREYVFGLMSTLGVVRRIRILPGNLSTDALAQVYSAIDVLIHPSTSIDENFGYAPREALACGASAAVTAYGGLRNADLDLPEVRRVATWVTAGGIRFDQIGLLKSARYLLQVEQPPVRRRVATISRRGFAHALHRIVDRHLRAARQAGPRCVLATEPGRSKSFLPVTRPDWSTIQEAVHFYVSEGAPHSNHLWQAWPATRHRDNITIQDPAWPASTTASDAEWKDYRYIRELGVAPLHNPDPCQRLIDVGALVPAGPS